MCWCLFFFYLPKTNTDRIRQAKLWVPVQLRVTHVSQTKQYLTGVHISTPFTSLMRNGRPLCPIQWWFVHIYTHTHKHAHIILSVHNMHHYLHSRNGGSEGVIQSISHCFHIWKQKAKKAIRDAKRSCARICVNACAQAMQMWICMCACIYDRYAFAIVCVRVFRLKRVRNIRWW